MCIAAMNKLRIVSTSVGHMYTTQYGIIRGVIMVSIIPILINNQTFERVIRYKAGNKVNKNDGKKRAKYLQ